MTTSTKTEQQPEDDDVETLTNAIHDLGGEDIARLARVMIRQHRHTGQRRKPKRPLAIAIEVLDAVKP